MLRIKRVIRPFKIPVLGIIQPSLALKFHGLTASRNLLCLYRVQIIITLSFNLSGNLKFPDALCVWDILYNIYYHVCKIYLYGSIGT